MRAEPPDLISERVLQLLAAARTRCMTREEASEQAILCLWRGH